MQSVVIYTANVGGRDMPHRQVEQDIPVTWRYITDRQVSLPPPWRPPLIFADDEWNPLVRERSANMRAKLMKCSPLTEADIAIWIDASMEVTSPSFARAAVAALDGAPLATWKHPRRDCIYDEVEASLGAEGQGGRYADLPLREQVESYRQEGYPAHNGLYACGTMVWTRDAYDIAAMWLAECLLWGHQDQVSFPVVCWRAGVKPSVFPFPQIERGLASRRAGYLANRWLRIHPHTPGTDNL